MELETKKIPIPPEIVEIWQRIVDSVAILLSVPSVMINRLDPPELEIFRATSSPNNPFPSGTRMQMAGLYCAAAAGKRQKLRIEDASKDPLWAESPTAKAGILAYLGFPLFWPDGAVFGTLCAVDTREKKWGEQSEKLIQAIKDAIEVHLALVTAMEDLNEKNRALELALSEVKTLQGFLPICASCKKIRDDQGYWKQIEGYFRDHSDVEFTHTLCPDCVKKLYPGLKIHHRR
jgi:GAF domain-containing protein